jgi:hypothetical protein
MRSSWEIKYAEYLDSLNINWGYEVKNFELILSQKETTYTPDFYLSDNDTFIEIKGYWRVDAKEKFEKFVKTYPDIKIIVYTKTDLKKLGIKI